MLCFSLSSWRYFINRICRLGVLDAVDIPPTFATDPGQFVALIAGGDHVLRHADEGVEDSRDVGATDLGAHRPTPNDTVIGISASGTTPYVLGGLEHARSCDSLSIGLVCVRPSRMEMEGNCQIMIDPLTGPEVIAGSTRMKAGTATKMILNMISTGVQIKLGQTHGNLMIGVRASNTKSKERARQIVRSVASEFTLPPTYSAILYNDNQLDAVLQRCGGKVKLALVVIVSGWGINLCEDALARRGGVLKTVLEDVRYETIVRVFNR
ncbi:SIS domain-containing protein [Marasmius fiardii PR-910]|nr:SIS domain-containing protein [Marasmius fiardii PR-910]